MSYRRRIVALGLLLFLPFGALEARLVWVQGVCGGETPEHSEHKVTRIEVIQPSRGSIFDRNGTCLARDERWFDVAVVLRDLKRADRALGDAAIALSMPVEDLAALHDEPDASIEALTKKMPGRAARHARALLKTWRSQPASSEVVADLAEVLGLPPEELLGKVVDIETRLEEHASQRAAAIELDRLEGELAAPRTIAAGLPYEKIREIDLQHDRFPGVVVQESVRRVYPMGRLAGLLVGYEGHFGKLPDGRDEYTAREEEGYFRRDFPEGVLKSEEAYHDLEESDAFRHEMIGRMGVERSYEGMLRGRRGLMITERDRRTGESRVLKMHPARPGDDLRLTIDLRAQAVVEGLLEERFLRRGQCSAAVVLDPNDGAILAMASVPGYDPNDFMPPVNIENQKLYFGEDVDRVKREKRLLNRAIAEKYACGSIFKVVTSVAGFEEGQITPDTWYECEGKYRDTPPLFKCDSYPGKHGRMDFVQAMAHSCNVFFFHVGEGTGVDALSAWGARLGLGRPTGIDLPHETSGDLPTPEWREAHKRSWYPNDTLNLSIGQGVLTVTPLQIAALLAFVANGGSVVHPHIALSSTTEPTPVRVSADTLARVRQGLLAVVNDPGGTAYKTGLSRFHVAGKTSTAEVVGVEGPKESHAWFAGYAPAEAPRYAFAILVEHGGHGADTAAPIAEEILEAIMHEGK